MTKIYGRVRDKINSFFVKEEDTDHYFSAAQVIIKDIRIIISESDKMNDPEFTKFCLLKLTPDIQSDFLIYQDVIDYVENCKKDFYGREIDLCRYQ